MSFKNIFYKGKLITFNLTKNHMNKLSRQELIAQKERAQEKLGRLTERQAFMERAFLEGIEFMQWAQPSMNNYNDITVMEYGGSQQACSQFMWSRIQLIRRCYLSVVNEINLGRIKIQWENLVIDFIDNQLKK